MEVREYLRTTIKGSKKKTKAKEDEISASDELENLLNAIQRAAEGEIDGNIAEIDALIDRSADVPKPVKRANNPKSAAKKAKPRRSKRTLGGDDDSDQDENATHSSSVREKRGEVRVSRKVALRKIVNSAILDDDEEE